MNLTENTIRVLVFFLALPLVLMAIFRIAVKEYKTTKLARLLLKF